MSSRPQPKEKLNTFNSQNYFNGKNEQSVSYPVAQGMLTLSNGVKWGDGSYQNSANGFGVPLTVEEQDGTPSVANVNTIKVTNGSLTDDGSGVVSITTGGGVTNPMTSDLDANGYSILNILETSTAQLSVEEVNDSSPVIYRNKGAVVSGNYYNVGEGLQMTDAEASCIVVSRCLDPGFKQTMVIHVSMFNAKAHLNLISNAIESDTPIFTLCSAGDDGLGSGGFKFFCNQNSSTWEYRVYRQQDDKGTGTYPANGYFNFSAAGAVPTSAWVITYAELDTSVHASAAVSGSFLAKTSLTSATLQTDTATATVSLSTARVNTDELNNNGGTGLVDVLTPIRMNNNDIQSAGVIGANAYYTGGPSILPLGAPGGPLYLDTANNRVGINVPNPQEDLEVDGNIQLDSSGPNKIKFYDSSATVERAEIDAAASGTTGGKLIFYTKEDPGVITARMTIEEDGRIQVTNRIENCPNPVNPQDVATKDYVDSSVPTGFVTNPMSADLDGGQFNITNIDLLQVQNGTGTTFSADAATNIVDVKDSANSSAIEFDANAYALRVKDNTAATQLSILGNVGSTTHSGNTIQQLGGIGVQPKLTSSFPRAGNNITMGKYGWDDGGNNPSNVALSRANEAAYYGGGGNIFCNSVRQNILYSGGAGSLVFPYASGFQGNSVLRQYYNGGDVKNVLLNCGNASGQFIQFQLPPITEAMVGMTIKVTRLRLNPTYYPGTNAAGVERHKVAVVINPQTPDLIGGPEELFVSGGGFSAGAFALDPFRVIDSPPPDQPTIYRGTNSLEFVATNCSDAQNTNLPVSNYIWQCISEFPSESVTVYETWNMTSSITGSGNVTIDNWFRNVPNPDGCRGQVLGGVGMTMDVNGHFTFPAPGYYKIYYKLNFRCDMNSGTGTRNGYIVSTNNNFASTNIEEIMRLGRISNGGAVPENIQLTSFCTCVLKIVDTANDKVRLSKDMAASADIIYGGGAESSVQFERIGDC